MTECCFRSERAVRYKKRHYNPSLQAYGGFVIALFILAVFATVIAIIFSSYDGPILTERNPNGSIDYWYLGRGAEK